MPSKSTRIMRTRKSRSSSFLAELYKILDNPSYNDVINWHQEGFVIKNIGQLEQAVLKNHFKHNNYVSFVRQLNSYGFFVKEKNLQQTIYKHEQINQYQRLQIHKKAIRKQKLPAYDLVSEHNNLIRQLESVKQNQVLLQKQMDYHVELMIHLAKRIASLNNSINNYIQISGDKFQRLEKNMLKMFPNARDYMILRMHNVMKLIYPDLYQDSGFESANTTPLPFWTK